MSPVKHHSAYCNFCKGEGRVLVKDSAFIQQTCPRCDGTCYEPGAIEIDNPKDEDIKP